jgi:hypothetical protein
MLGTISESRSGHRGGIAAGDGSKQSASTVENRSSHEGTSGTFKPPFAAFSAVSTRLPLFVLRLN